MDGLEKSRLKAMERIHASRSFAWSVPVSWPGDPPGSGIICISTPEIDALRDTHTVKSDSIGYEGVLHLRGPVILMT